MPASRETADYPHIVDRKAKWQEIRLYSFGGWYAQRGPYNELWYANAIFGGFKYNLVDGQILGMMVQGEFGSEIVGKFLEDKLEFKKEPFPTPGINYSEDSTQRFKFQRATGNLWVGKSYLYEDGEDITEARIKLMLIHDNAFGIELGDLMGTDSWSGAAPTVFR